MSFALYTCTIQRTHSVVCGFLIIIFLLNIPFCITSLTLPSLVDIYRAMLWTVIEIASAIVCANLPLLRPVLPKGTLSFSPISKLTRWFTSLRSNKSSSEGSGGVKRDGFKLLRNDRQSGKARLDVANLELDSYLDAAPTSVVSPSKSTLGSGVEASPAGWSNVHAT